MSIRLKQKLLLTDIVTHVAISKHACNTCENLLSVQALYDHSEMFSDYHVYKVDYFLFFYLYHDCYWRFCYVDIKNEYIYQVFGLPYVLGNFRR